MRKHKSVVAVLLAIMMIFTFMPTMAFAETAPKVTWAKDYTSVTIEGYGTYGTTRTFNTETGMVDVTANTTDVSGIPPIAGTAYYDLNNAEFAMNPTNALAGTYVNPPAWGAFGTAYVSGFLFKAPSYVTNASETAKTFIKLSLLNALGDWTGTVKYTKDGKEIASSDINTSAYYAQDQEFDVSLDVTYNVEKEFKTPVYGTVASKHVLVKGSTTGDPEDTRFYIDTVGKTEEGMYNNEVVALYDGDEHTVVASECKGYNTKWTVYNDKTGEWDAVDAVKVKDVSKKKVSAKLSFFKTTNTTTTPDYVMPVTVDVYPAMAPTFGFDEDGDEGKYKYSVEDEEYNALDYIVVTAGVLGNSSKEFKKQNAANKKAAAANESELMSLFADSYEIKAKAKKSSPNTVTLTIEEKDVTEEEAKALEKKYEQLMLNFYFPNEQYSGITEGAAEATMYLNMVEQKADNIEISAVSKVTYSGKKTTKKGVLKAKKTITVKAKADSGKKVSYKLLDAPNKITINKKTGKITVKKGLKAGTYKFVVRATTANDKYYAPATEFHTIKVIVKK
jgi:hypothetical protein